MPHLNKPYIGYRGPIQDQLPHLLADGLRPLSSAEVMQQRLVALRISPAIARAWWEDSIETADVVLYSPNGSFKVVHDAATTLRITSQSRLHEGLLAITEELYAKLPGNVYARQSVTTNPPGTQLTPAQARLHPVWLDIANGDQKLLDRYVLAVYERLRAERHIDSEIESGMGFLPAPPRPSYRATLVTLNDTYHHESDLVLGNPLNTGGGYLIGTPNAQGP